MCVRVCVVLFASVWRTAAKKFGKKVNSVMQKKCKGTHKNGNQFFDFFIVVAPLCLSAK